MSITIGGILKCQKSGPALLECDLGKFVITDDRLKQLPAGSHEGLFEVEQIKPNSQVTDRGLLIELIAKLKRLALTETSVVQTELELFANREPQSNDEELFGEPLGKRVALDPNSGRELLRKQVLRLRELGYSFDKSQQVWLA